jgi:hypothetical protein
MSNWAEILLAPDIIGGEFRLKRGQRRGRLGDAVGIDRLSTLTTNNPPSGGETPAGDAAGSAWSRASQWFDAFPWAPWLASGIVHGGLLLIVSLLIVGVPEEKLMWLTGGEVGPPLEEMNLDQLAPLDDVAVPGGEPGEASLGPVVAGDDIELPGPIAGTVGNVRTGPTSAGGLTSEPAGNVLDALATEREFRVGDFDVGLEALTNPLATRGGGLEGRKFENRLAAALAAGGTQRSEEAVEAGLAWLAEHQFADGGWRFNLEEHPRCAGYCRDSGSYDTTTAATGLALLSFLGAGYTHQEGKYAEVVSRGLYYLEHRMEITDRGGDLRDNGPDDLFDGLAGGVGRRRRDRDDTMYSHGIASIALIEAYAMTGDPARRKPAQEAVTFIINAQYDDGGWRYQPQGESSGPGDMTVTGWQLMALKSAMLAGIEVPYEVWSGASDFVDSLASSDGSQYGYLRGQRGTVATDAIGLLCRMIGGWPRDARPLLKGAAKLSQQQPHLNNVYFIFYASQVLHHLGGPRWEKWNPRMREYLVETQAVDGHEAGSWYFDEQHSSPGGRLYTTAMAIMSLEVYYRYMPLYGEAMVEKAPR